MKMYDYIYRESLRRAKHKIWIFSDLQQRIPENAKECLEICMADYEYMGKPADMIWYLGDAIQGGDVERLQAMCDMQEAAFVSTGIPLCFVAGNHDLEYIRRFNGDRVFFYDMVKRHPDWHCADSIDSPYYKLRLGNYMIYFFPDHVAKDFSWYTTNGALHGETEKYPHTELLETIRTEMEKDACPIITASHYSFAGGSRQSEMLSTLLPFPQNVKLHFYGHAHIGDFAWAGVDAYQRITWMNNHDIPQINVSSFEHIRGIKCRSVFLHIYDDDSCGIFFRNHDDHVFSECYFPANVTYPHG